jgi:transposase InsO family protein
MYMPYSQNPQLPHVRMEAVRLVRSGWSTVKVARHLGYSQGVVSKWMQRAPADLRARVIPTRSSRPYHHPHELSDDLVRTIIAYRQTHRRCALVLHHLLKKDGYDVSLSSVKRTLQRNELTRFSKWKKWHTYPPRPVPEAPGILVEIDTIHDGAHDDRLYVYTLLDVCSRWAYAVPSLRINTHRSLRFVEQGRDVAPFAFQTLQSDHGSEFSKWFTKRIMKQGLSHRHSRVRQPNDNAHLERWNRTIQEECLSRIPRSLSSWRKEIPEYLHWYNQKRPHMGLDMKTPIEKIAELFQAIDR